ncbi:MAG: NAD(P)/FAD-dependent oxidoreductase [Flavobacteriaceae bacterium]|nr:NAD(P)/FAD-dependent oxidoreductase [Flavobacteriaceae bacterium]
MKQTFDILIVGGGAAGFFTAINAAENIPNANIAILERGNEVLTKVKVSGGGRCNVTHAEFLPEELTKNYPRGEKELLGPFHTFMTGDTIAWFEKRGVSLKIEEDGRMFPISDSSQTIIDCFLSEAKRLNISIVLKQAVQKITFEAPFWKLETTSETFLTKKLVIATGSNPKIWKLLEGLGHTIIPPVPSLFTFTIQDPRIKDLPGVATNVTVEIISENGKSLLQTQGPLLITHQGMSGPAILKLSAWGARILEPLNYHFSIKINWLEDQTKEETLESLRQIKLTHGKQTIVKYAQFDLPKRLWKNLIKNTGIPETITWAEASKEQLVNIANELTEAIFKVTGKNTFKEEFVTAGGIDLKEVNFKTFESKLHPNLYFAGEVLNIDAITGGFNFQNAWTGGFMIAKALAENS